MFNYWLKCPNLEVGKLKCAFYLYSIMQCIGIGQNTSSDHKVYHASSFLFKLKKVLEWFFSEWSHTQILKLRCWCQTKYSSSAISLIGLALASLLLVKKGTNLETWTFIYKSQLKPGHLNSKMGHNNDIGVQNRHITLCISM